MQSSNPKYLVVDIMTMILTRKIHNLDVVNYGDTDDNDTYEHTNVPIVVCIEEVIIAIITKKEDDGCISNGLVEGKQCVLYADNNDNDDDDESCILN